MNEPLVAQRNILMNSEGCTSSFPLPVKVGTCSWDMICHCGAGVVVGTSLVAVMVAIGGW